MTTPQKRRQRENEGEGPLYHRVYSVEFAASPADARTAMEILKRDMNQFSPQWLASFVKVKGSKDELSLGDEFEVKLSSPWEAPVRVSKLEENSFTLVTLEGHLEAGEIRFSLQPLQDGKYRFEIESLARSSDKVVDFLYDKLPICRFAQQEMWEKFCAAFAKSASGGAEAPTQTITERQDEETGQWQSV